MGGRIPVSGLEAHRATRGTAVDLGACDGPPQGGSAARPKVRDYPGGITTVSTSCIEVPSQ